MSKTSLLVISAHAADFVWRSGGVIAKYVKEGKSVKVVCLSFGERGESAELWKRGLSLEEVKNARREESSRAAEVLGAPISFMDWDDYPLRIDDSRLMQLVKLIRESQPQAILTHGRTDPFNMDHEATANAVHNASILAIAQGVMPDLPICNQPRRYSDLNIINLSFLNYSFILPSSNFYPLPECSGIPHCGIYAVFFKQMLL